MRRVDFTPDKPGFLNAKQQAFWNGWTARAATATEKALKHWKEHETKPSLPSDLWSELKRWLLDEFFYNKCAYCEGPMGATSFGDAEHYRPKGQVTVMSDGIEVKVALATGGEHPGYFWLAYDWKNLVPACQRCNSTGKGTLFPLPEGVTHVFKPGASVEELDKCETPALLHPCRDQPSSHLEFMEHGLIKAKDGSEKGKKSIETYLLDRPKLIDERAERQADVTPALATAVSDAVRNGTPLSDSMDRYTGPKARYTAAVTALIKLKKDVLLKRLETLLGN